MYVLLLFVQVRLSLKLHSKIDEKSASKTKAER
jgi:hypothetical protein